MDDYIIRWSKTRDVIQIENLLYKTFGEQVKAEGGFKDIAKGRYLCVVLPGEEIAAVTGFQHCNNLGGLEMTWTATRPDCRHRGYMQELFSRLLQTTDEDVYCICWRLSETDPINLHTLMDLNGFEEVQRGMITRSGIVCNSYGTCPYSSNTCKCFQDLYVRRGSTFSN